MIPFSRSRFPTPTFLHLVVLFLLVVLVVGDDNSTTTTTTTTTTTGDNSTTVDSACAADNTCRDKDLSLKYRIGGLVSILVGSAIGVAIPTLGKSIHCIRPEGPVFFMIKSFAAGVILATGAVHVLPDSFDSLTSPCLNDDPWGKFPFTGLIFMMAALFTLMVESFATGYFKRQELSKAKPVGDLEMEANAGGGEHRHQVTEEAGNPAGHNHVHGSGLMLMDDASHLARSRIIAEVLEFGIIVHSVIIGLALGASESPCTVKPLVAALTFHQFFEGMGLGACIMQGKFKAGATLIMAIFFSLTTPIGVAIGIGISSGYDENSPTALIVQGVLDAASAGILVYLALVDMLAVDMVNPKIQSNGRLQALTYIFLFLGVGLMSLLAIWA